MFTGKHGKVWFIALQICFAAVCAKLLIHTKVQHQREDSAQSTQGKQRHAQGTVAPVKTRTHPYPTQCRVGSRLYVETPPVSQHELGKWPSHSAVVAEWPYGNATTLKGITVEGANVCAIWPGTQVEIISSGEDNCGLRITALIREEGMGSDCHIGQEFVYSRPDILNWQNLTLREEAHQQSIRDLVTH